MKIPFFVLMLLLINEHFCPWQKGKKFFQPRKEEGAAFTAPLAKINRMQNSSPLLSCFDLHVDDLQTELVAIICPAFFLDALYSGGSSS
jgi:hypothetical protein